MSMTQQERVIAQILHQETDVLPYTLTFELGFGIEDCLDAYYHSDHWRRVLNNAIIRRRFVSDRLWTRDLDVGTYWTDLFGTRWKMEPRPRSMVEPALKEPSLDGYRFPEVDECFDPDWESKALQEIAAYKDRFVVIDYGSGLFERSWMLRGYENVLMDMILNPDFYEELLDRLMALQMGIIDQLIQLPVDGILFSDDWGYQNGVTFGANRWRRIFKPRYARMYQQVHAAGKYVLTHCCGSIEEILPDAIEIGLDVYESVQPEAKDNSPYELKRKFGDRLTFWGGLGSQSTIPFGTPREIKVEVERLCTEMGKGGGYILAPAKPIQPETPIENIAALLESFFEQSGVTILL